jgi:transcriptional regulator
MKKRGPKNFSRSEPIFRDKVLTVVKMRDNGATFAEIANTVGGTRMNACNAYRRWREWAREVAS